MGNRLKSPTLTEMNAMSGMRLTNPSDAKLLPLLRSSPGRQASWRKHSRKSVVEELERPLHDSPSPPKPNAERFESIPALTTCTSSRLFAPTTPSLPTHSPSVSSGLPEVQGLPPRSTPMSMGGISIELHGHAEILEAFDGLPCDGDNPVSGLEPLSLRGGRVRFHAGDSRFLMDDSHSQG